MSDVFEPVKKVKTDAEDIKERDELDKKIKEKDNKKIR